MTQDPNKFLMGGVKVPHFFSAAHGVGSSITGIIKSLDVAQQRDFDTDELKYWDDGKPMMQLVITLATDLRDPSIENDNGDRRIFAKGKMQYAIRDAVRDVNPDGLEIGGRLTVTQTGLEEPKKKGAKGTKLFSASYVSAANVALQAGAPATPQIPQQQVVSPPVQQPVAAPPSAPPATPTVDPAAAAAAIAALTPEQRAALGLPPA